jgi:putative tricarboxylic transport membrane protein
LTAGASGERAVRGNLVIAVLLLVFAVVFWFAADAIPKSRLGGTVGADGLPKLLAVALGVLSLVLIVQTLFFGRARVVAADGDPSRERGESVAWREHLRAFGMIVIGIGYLVIVPYAGYLVAVALLLLIVALYNGKRPSPGLFLFMAAGAVGFYVLFVLILDVPLPAGVWPRLLG